MSIYKLCYLNKDVYYPINLEEITKNGSIEEIDKFTLEFENKTELIEFLKEKKVYLPSETLAISKLKKSDSSYTPIYKGDRLFYEKDKSLLNLDFAKKYIIANSNDLNFIKILAQNYVDKYIIAQSKTTKTIKSYKIAADLLANVKTSGSMSKRSQKNLNLLIDSELYKGTIKSSNDGWFFEKNSNEINYKNLRTLILLIIDYEKTKIISEAMDRPTNNYSDEEGLTMEDWLRVIDSDDTFENLEAKRHSNF